MLGTFDNSKGEFSSHFIRDCAGGKPYRSPILKPSGGNKVVVRVMPALGIFSKIVCIH